MAVHAFNEGPALERLILSSLHAADTFDEWVVLDHRSSDNTQAVLDRVEPLLAAYGVTLTRLYEPRDFSAAHTFAHVRDKTIRAAKNEVVALMDADFILGKAWRDTFRRAQRTLAANKYLAVVRFKIPVIWEHLTTDSAGNIIKHGGTWIHQYSNRIMRKDAVEYRQTGADGRWEKLHFTTRAKGRQNITNDGNILVSVNVKPPERIALRETMTFFLQDAIQGVKTGEWLDQYEAGGLRQQGEYQLTTMRVRAALNLANLRVEL